MLLLPPAVGDRAQQRDQRGRAGGDHLLAHPELDQRRVVPHAALKKVSPGRNITTKSGAGWNWIQYALLPSADHVVPHLAGVVA